MTGVDSFASYAALIREEVAKALSSAPRAYAEPMRDQLAMLEIDDGEVLLPAWLCLVTADAAGGTTEQALPSATAIALVDLMARGFLDLSNKPATGVEARWGFARSLNAGDGFFAQAQRSLLSTTGMSAEQAVAATTAFDSMCARFSQDLYQAQPGGSNAALFEGAAVLGGIATGLDAATLKSVGRFAAALMSGSGLEEALAGLPVEMRPRLGEAAQYIIRRRSR